MEILQRVAFPANIKLAHAEDHCTTKSCIPENGANFLSGVDPGKAVQGEGGERKEMNPSA